MRRPPRGADGGVWTDGPLVGVTSLVGQVRAGLGAAGGRAPGARISNWFVWNVQDTPAEAFELARRQLGFRLYYIRDVAASIGLTEAEARELERRQPEMLRAIFEGRDPWQPEPRLTELLIRQLPLSGGRG